jgi:hypothetical protein
MDRNKPQKLLNSIKCYTFIITTFCHENWEELPELVITMKQINVCDWLNNNVTLDNIWLFYNPLVFVLIWNLSMNLNMHRMKAAMSFVSSSSIADILWIVEHSAFLNMFISKVYSFFSNSSTINQSLARCAGYISVMKFAVTCDLSISGHLDCNVNTTTYID